MILRSLSKSHQLMRLYSFSLCAISDRNSQTKENPKGKSTTTTTRNGKEIEKRRESNEWKAFVTSVVFQFSKRYASNKTFQEKEMQKESVQTVLARIACVRCWYSMDDSPSRASTWQKTMSKIVFICRNVVVTVVQRYNEKTLTCQQTINFPTLIQHRTRQSFPSKLKECVWSLFVVVI